MRLLIFTIIWINIVGIGVVLTGCRDHREIHCLNGACECLHGDDCDIECVSPPCHVLCSGSGTQCNGQCANGACTCGSGAECAFDCKSGPCHVNCQGNDFCAGICWNGNCSCSSGSNCYFECASGPCHVTCAGNNRECKGECANGTCQCGPGSNCTFRCNDNNCKTNCDPGSACALACPNGNVGVPERCWISSCAAGDVKICNDGLYTVCGMECSDVPEFVNLHQ
ncbi:MAG: hypothetical protein JXR76_07310 [Deltaproteobacteria bacterium]|nr:hypothetical protein [Deltaproteobacteria bacterium]